MSINISASAIKDYISCPAKFYYRTIVRGVTIPTQAMAIGNAVHKLIECFWNDKVSAIENINNFMISYGVDTADEKAYHSIRTMLDSFYHNYSDMLESTDLIEYNFKIKYARDVYIVGKYDRIIGEGSTIVDWKTGNSLPRSIDKDVQFLLYYDCFTKEFGRAPANVLYVSLSQDKTLRLKPNKKLLDIIYDRVIPAMLRCYNTKDYPPVQLFNEFSVCNRCSYKEACFADNLGVGKNELAD